ncbi:MAG: class I SAM-dependent methyltransferase [Burkholderiales bacterium]|nr:class I SAM-dependent methyltransferase [Burkholderiales bacterium]
MNERDYHDHHYESEAARILESPIFTRVHDRAARDFLRCTGTGRAHRVLSLGCGDGSLERRLAPHAGEIVGIDISTVAIERARTKSRAAGLGNLSFLVSDSAMSLLEGLGQFDVIAAFAFLHHLDDAAIRDTLLAGRRALRSGGVFYSTDPSRRRLVGLFAGLVRRAYDRYHSLAERELDPEALAAFAAAAGLSRPQIAYTDYALGPIAWLAPGTPRWLIPALEAIDNLALSAPLVNRYASSFSLLAHAP